MSYMGKSLKIMECPRDAMQGIVDFIPTSKKIDYLNRLLNVGFDMLDFGSFVSPKAIPQLKDTEDVLKHLNFGHHKTELLAIIANVRGAQDACHFDQISYLGFPFSVSETFQKRNTNSSIDQSFKSIEEIQNLCLKHNKTLLIYLSMAFGNPYGDPWHEDVVADWALKIQQKLEVRFISLADTIGVSSPKIIESLFPLVSQTLKHKNIKLGAHLHTLPHLWQEKMEALVKTNCDWIDGALKGYGGCPMAKDELTGNMPTEKMVDFLFETGYDLNINRNLLQEALIFAENVFHS